MAIARPLRPTDYGLLALGLIVLAAVPALCQESTVLTPPYFNIAEKRKVTVNATCGEGVAQKEVYCKLVGYDSRLDVGRFTYDILDGQICDYCYPPTGNETSDKSHPVENVVDGDISTWWQSPPISRGLKYNRVTLEIDLVQTFQVAYVVVTMANSPRPGVWALERSVDHGQTWQTWQYFAGNDAECMKFFNVHADEKITSDDQVICSTEFSKVLPIEDGEIYVSLTAGRPSAKDPLGSDTLRRWIIATNIRLRLISTKTMLGHLMSVAQGDKTVTRRYYYSIKEISVGGRCVCNGHAYVCPPSETDPDLLVCQCQHNTAGPNCEQCAPGFVQKKWRRYTRKDPYECEPCNCNGHSDKCHYDDEVDIKQLSMDIHGNMEGGGVCEECQHFTSGINCETCQLGYFRPEGVLPNATEPCIPCQCDSDHRYTGSCAPESGECECKPAFQGAKDCSACADGYYDYPECKPCDCYANGTKLMDNGLPFCVADGSTEVQCPCLDNFSGAFCKECKEGYYNFPECLPCQCNPTGSQNDACDRETGQCQCNRNYGSRQCDQCHDGYYNYPACSTCDCDPKGTTEEVCNKSTGQCLCKEGFGGPRCDRCEPGWFDYPTCTPCECADQGSGSPICDQVTGQCRCYNNYGGRQCAECSSGYFGYPDCNACGCESLGSKGVSCDNNGACNCRPNFVGLKCDQCAPERYNYPICEECNCNPDGVTEDFFAKGGCDSVPIGSLCTCKANVMGRICDTCKPLFWNLQGWNPSGCEDCGCNRVGTIGALGVCDTLDGQCACKPNVDGSRVCDECKDGFYGLSNINGLGCDHCQCDVGGTEISAGEIAVCDKTSGQCRCRSGISGRRCNEVQDSYYVPTLYQYQFEIEDGYRRDGSPVRIGYDDTRFPDYSWRGYGSYSQLQNEVLLDVPIEHSSVYRMVIRYSNPNPEPVIGEVSVVRTAGDGDAHPQTHQVLFQPTGGDPQLVTVSGDKGIYASPFDLEPGTWTTAVKINNEDPLAPEILVDYFVFIPREYYEPGILKEDVYEPCLAGKVLPYCRHYSYPDLSAHPRTYSTQSNRPGGGPDVYSWSDNMEVLAELGTSKLASLAGKWQPELVYPVQLNAPGKHVLAVVFYTPDNLKPEATPEIIVNADGDAQEGRAYIFNCPYSSLCRQVVTDPQGRVAHFDFKGVSSEVVLKAPDEFLNVGIDAVVAIPLEDWSLDLVTPSVECIRKEGACIIPTFPDVPDQSTVVPFIQSGSGAAAPEGANPDVSLYYVDEDTPLVDIHGRVPKPGLYVLVAQYFQPNSPEFDLRLNVSYANVGEDTDMANLLANGQFHEAVLPLPNCRFNAGCRSVMNFASDPKKKDFNLNDEFFISGNQPVEKPVWLESITAIPSESFTESYLEPESVESSLEYARRCGQDNFYIETDNEDCKASIVSVASHFNNGALECNCDMTGSLGYDCAKIGGQCPCKPNVIGRQCTRCKPGFFGYPECKQCNCPPTAQCNEDTGECICAPHVTGTDDNPCSECEENTFGYDPITGCQECMCETAGTVNGNMSCSLDSGACYCKENVVGRTCEHCASGFYQYPDCLQCPCDLSGTTQDICNQESSECLCKPNVEGNECDQCKEGTFDLEETNPDGCKDCFCFGKTSFCSSHERLIREKISSMDGWGLTSFKITRTVTETKPRNTENLPNYSGELAVSFGSNPEVDLRSSSLYFKAPKDFIHNQIKSYGGKLSYQITYSGYEFDGAPRTPDVLLIGAELSILFHSGLKVTPNAPLNVSAPIDPYYWVLPSGAPIDRSKMMVVLNNLKGVYIKASYGLDRDGQARLSGVTLDSAKELGDAENITDTDTRVTSVEFCRCPDGYYGYSCEDCALGYFRSQEGPLGPICAPCNCHGHATNCHPLTGECITLVPRDQVKPTEYQVPDDGAGRLPEYGDPDDADDDALAMKMFCHLMPEQCVVDNSTKTCKHNTTGAQCDKCEVGFYGNAKAGTSDDCKSCPCPLPENNFAESCDALIDPARDDDSGGYCVCKPNYVGDRCEFCGPGYYGQPETIGDLCKPCMCNDNINVSDPDACDRFSGLCQKCLEHTSGDNCERCENWYFGDAVVAKNCQECRCNKLGTEVCNHVTGTCACLPGVEGELCDRCQSDHWGFESGQPGCTACDCSEASESTQCDLTTGQCRCKNGVTGQKCDRCMAGYWNLGPNGCESCGCNTEFAVGGTCDPVTGQCACLEGVIGQNCDHCPLHWVLVVNETRTERPEWKRPFSYDEGCFPCSSCVEDLMEATDGLNNSLAPIMVEFKGVEASYFAFKRLRYIEKDVDRLMPEIQLLNPQEGSRRLQPLEQQVAQQQKTVKSLNIEYKRKVMSDLSKEARDLENNAASAVDEMSRVGAEIHLVTNEMKIIADGLGSGVTPKQIETSVELGRSWLNEMKANNFTDDRELAVEKQRAAMELQTRVKTFAEPVNSFKDNVTATEVRMEKLKNNLEDLRNHSDNALQMLRVASTLNFRNSEPAVSYKLSRIGSMQESAEGNVKLGSDLGNEANSFLQESQAAFGNLQTSSQTISDNLEEYLKREQSVREAIHENYKLLGDARAHADQLENKASALQDTLDNAKMPATEALQAAHAYEMIIKAVANASEATDQAKDSAENAASMSVGVGNKATQSKDRTQDLYQQARTAQEIVQNELETSLNRQLANIDDLSSKNKVTKDAVEKVTKNLDTVENLGDVLKSTLTNADDAETLAHDALTSIDARANEIKKNMKSAKKLQDNHEEMKFSIDATKKALADLESRDRPKRDADPDALTEDDIQQRLQKLVERQQSINSLRQSVSKMMGSLKKKVANVRTQISNIETGITFTQGSHLKLRNPPELSELAAHTKIKFFFNVTRPASGYGRAFLFYLGNEENTHTKTPQTFTDDYIAAEIVESGRVKVTLDLGAGPMEVLSNHSIIYGQWHELVIDRRGYYITVIVRSQEGQGEITEDAMTDVPLPRIDENGRPMGSVFNLHVEHSSIFVGGFPRNARIQERIRETHMDGQIEGFEIGGNPVSLWNFVESNSLEGAVQRNKFKERPAGGIRFSGQGFVSIDRSNYADLEEEFVVKLKFKPSGPNGILFLVGNPDDGDYVSLELQTSYLVYSFNLGDGTVSLESTTPCVVNEWYSAEITRRGRVGSLYLNGAKVGELTSTGSMERLSVNQNIYLGGYPDSTTPYADVRASNFSGCMEEVFLGPDKVDLSPEKVGAHGIEAGCSMKSESLATFPASSPGYIQLEPLQLNGSFEMTFMFKTAQERGLLFYMFDTPNQFYYISLSLIRGVLQLNVFPRNEIWTERGSDKPTLFNDNKWHTVTVIISDSSIQLLVDDYEHFKLDIAGSAELPLMNLRYNVFLGGVPEETRLVSGSVASDAPFIGCIRDVLVKSPSVVSDFNAVPYHTGVQLGTCVASTAKIYTDEDAEDITATTDASGHDKSSGGHQDTKKKDKEAVDEETEPGSHPEEHEEDGWSFTEVPNTRPEPRIYGECKLPISPAADPDIDRNSGLRFGTQKDTFLEFDRVLRIKKASSFGIEFKTTEKDGIIFYIADERNVDFIALLIKDGKLIYGFNCGSGATYITTDDAFNDGAWHFAEFSRQGNKGKLLIDGNIKGESEADGSTKNIEVSSIFHLGGLPAEKLEQEIVKRNLMKVSTGFIGCLRKFRLRDSEIGKWSKNNKAGVIPCSKKVEPGYFFGTGGGHLHAFKRFRVGLDFDITMQIKPRNISGLLLAIQGRRDYLILQMVDGTITFTVDNGRGPITAVFKPPSTFHFCDGKWHEIHAVKAKNVVTLSVDDVFAQPGIGVPGVSSTDTNHGLFIGGHPKFERLTGRQTETGFVGCIRKVVVEGIELEIDPDMLKGDVLSHVCPTI